MFFSGMETKTGGKTDGLGLWVGQGKVGVRVGRGWWTAGNVLKISLLKESRSYLPNIDLRRFHV